jgi:hypothetical protein
MYSKLDALVEEEIVGDSLAIQIGLESGSQCRKNNAPEFTTHRVGVTRRLTARAAEEWKKNHPDGGVIHRDLSAMQIPPITDDWGRHGSRRRNWRLLSEHIFRHRIS